MMHVERFTPVDQWGQVLTKCMDKDPEGIYVLASDYDALRSRLAEAERDADQLLKERDEAEAMADKLADAIATLTGADIGEHSSGNCPWHAALEAAEEHRAADSATVGQDCQTLAALDSEDAARFRWLCDDHADRAIRHLRNSLLERMSVMSLSAVRAAISIRLSNVSEQAKNSHHE